MFDSLSDTTINLCRNILLKSVKCIFLVIPKFWGFKKSTNVFMGFRIHFILKIGTIEIVKNRYDVTHGIATNYVLCYCVLVRRLIALTVFSAFRRCDNFSIAI